jgi:hypothetical protein
MSVYPKFLDKCNDIIATENIGLDQEQIKWPAYEAIVTQSTCWPVECRSIMLPDGYSRLSQWPTLAARIGEWMEDAKRIAVAGYHQVLEDGPDKCDSESDGEYSDARKCTFNDGTGESAPRERNGRRPSYSCWERGSGTREPRRVPTRSLAARS